MNKCEICDKKNDQVKNSSIHDFFKPHELIAGFRLSQKFLPKLKTKYPTEYAKLDALLSQKYEPLIKELLEPNLKKTNQVFKNFFQKKGKLVPGLCGADGSDRKDSWLCSYCESCSQELLKQVKLAVDEIEWGRIEKKGGELGKEVELIFEQIPKEELENELGDFGKEEKSFTLEFIEQEIDKLNKEIIAEREREQKWQGYQLNSLDCRW